MDDEVAFEPFEDGMHPVHNNGKCDGMLSMEPAVDSETELVHGECNKCGMEFGIPPERFYEHGISIGGR